MSIEQVSQQVVLSNSIRRHFDRTPEEYAEQIKEEAQELIDEIRESMLTGTAFNVVGEIGDLFILLVQLCHDLGIDPKEAMTMKDIRNDKKYSTHITNNGYDRETAIQMCKQAWKAEGGDYKFSEVYLDHLSND